MAKASIIEAGLATFGQASSIEAGLATYGQGKVYRGWPSNLWPKASSIEAGLATYDQGKLYRGLKPACGLATFGQRKAL
ncbi:hypothetical protein DPMN_182634 [Dreissena polymorpha]|uniref:Uncharacterized protein n=1 Tax=Dreissena polymorpha TaxID=45954 RepID=A0A9D4I2T7_DREPO|nr:hypothetical protein DPMN_182634 [Dreissena polymorpha]